MRCCTGIETLTHAEALEACKLAGVNVRPGASLEDMHLALAANFEASTGDDKLSVRAVPFEEGLSASRPFRCAGVAIAV